MTKDISWQKKHREVISDFLKYLNGCSDDYILKGGTSLMLCYGLDRFSEDIDLDGKGGIIGNIVNDFCAEKGYSYRVAKDTDTVKRYMVNYGDTGRPLKVEVSFRKKVIEPSEVTKFNGVNVYKIDSICTMKANAYNSRDKIRDLYDLSFICNNYWEQLSSPVKSIVRDTLSYKGIEQFDFLIKDQSDELLDSSKLADDFLKMYDRLNLLADERELQILNSAINNSYSKQGIDEWKREINQTRSQMNKENIEGKTPIKGRKEEHTR